MTKQKADKTVTTELEGAVLGVVRRDGPCTPYAIRHHFVESRSPHWSGSAGAIYPLVRRLEARGLVRSSLSARGRRAHRNYRITQLGAAALKRWLQASIAESDATLIHDALRTRMLFLSALSPQEALSFVTDALDEIRPTLKQARADCRNHPVGDDHWAYFAARNALLVTRARVVWLTQVQARLEASLAGKGH